MESLEDRRLLATLTWVGDVNNLWNTNAAGNTNWSGDLLPANNDTLVFPAAGANQTNVNDTVVGRTYTLSFTGGTYSISGNSITLSSTGITDSTPGGITTNVNLDGLAVAGNTGLNAVNANATLRITSPISGVNATLSKFGAGTVEYAQAVNNTFPGSTQVNDGTLRLSSTAGNGAIVGSLTIGNGVGLADSARVTYGQALGQIANDRTVTVNSDGLWNLAGLAPFLDIVGAVVVNGGHIDTANSNGFQIDGTGLTMTGGTIDGNGAVHLNGTQGVTTNATTTSAVINAPLDLGGVNRTFDVGLGSPVNDLDIFGVVSNGAITKAGTGWMGLHNTNNSYAGTTTVNAGRLTVGANGALGAATGLANRTIVNAPGLVSLPGGVFTPEWFEFNGANTLRNVGNNGISGNVTLDTDLTLNIFGGDTLFLFGDITGGPSNITKVGGGTLQYVGGSTFDSTTILTEGIVQANGVIGPVSLDGGRLQGFGTTGPITSTANGGTVAPGTSPGTIFTGTLNWNAATTLDEEIDGVAADQIVVTGGVNLGDALLNVIILSGPPGGSVFTIISNDGTDAVNGFFTSNATNPLTMAPAGTLTEGEVFEVGGTFFKISYIGGDGNDVTLAVVSPPVAQDDVYAFFETHPGPFLQTFFSPFSILDNDFDPDGDPLVPVLDTTTANGELILHGDGTFEYTPNPGFNGIDQFTYWAFDGTVAPDPALPPGPGNGLFYSNLATVTIFVNPVVYNPVANADSYSVDPITTGPPTGTGAPGDPFVYTLTILPPDGVLENDFSPENLFPPGGPAPNQGLEAQLISGPVHGTLTLNTDGSFTYTPDTGFNGLDSFVYRALDTDTGLLSEDVTVNLFVSGLNFFAPQANPDAYGVNEDDVLFVGGPGVLANDTDLDGDFLTAVNFTQPVIMGTITPAGVVTLNADGSFIYEPPADFNGTVTFTYQAFDGTNLSAVTTVTITVFPIADAPVAFDDSYFMLENDNTLSNTLSVPAPGVMANDLNPDGVVLTVVQVGPGPAHAASFTLNADGSFDYTPLAFFTGTDSFNYYLLDSASGLTSGIATVTITVQAVNFPPVANDDTYITNEDVTLTIAASGVLSNDSDPDGDPLTASLVLAGLPQHGIVTLNPDGSFTYIPNANYNGPDTFQYRAWDGANFSNVATVTIQINPILDRPTAANDSYSVLEDTLLTVTSPGITINDTNVDDPTFGTTFTNTQIVVVNGPLHGTLGGNILGGPPNNGAFTYQPNANFFGTDSFTYFIRNTLTGSTSDTATVTINVVAVPDLPVGNPDAFSTNEDIVLHVAGPGVLKNDVNVDKDELNAVVIDGPSNGRVVLNSDGSFDYFPDENFNGTDTFTYVPVNGAGQGNTTTVTITVRPVNDRPVARDDSYTMQEDDTLTVPTPGILGNDTDADGDTLTAVLVNNVQNGTLTLNADGSFTYVPNPDFVGTDTFTYRATDGTLQSNLATVTITVQAVAPTTINLDPASDTGVSDTDRITKDNTPTFFGTTVPNLLVRLYVRPLGSTGAPVLIGQDVADSQGNWRITSAVLPDGRGEFFAAAFRPNGQSTGRVIEFGTLTLDTVAPRVTSAILSPKTGQVYIAFQDNMTGMAQPNIGNVGNYTFAKIYTHAPRAFAVNSATALPVNLPTDPQTVVLDVFGGRNAGHGRYLFAAISGMAFPNGVGGIADVAGNALDGEFTGVLPSGNGQAGGDFQAQFNTNGNDLTLASPATEFVPYFLALNNSTPVPSIPFNLARARTGVISGQGNGGLLPLQGTRKLGAARQARAARPAQGGQNVAATNLPAGPLSGRLRGN